MRLSEAGIQTLLVVGNHDVSPASGRAHTLQEFETLQVPNIHVISQPQLFKPEDLNGLPVQVIGIPWLNRSGMAAAKDIVEEAGTDINALMERKLSEIIESFLNDLDGVLPAILTSHVSVQGASYGNERSVMLGRDLVLAGSLVRDQRLDYVALGHIHKAQNLNEGGHHPVIYPGSIERVDFGEVDDRKTYIIAEVDRDSTSYKQVDLPGRRFIDRSLEITRGEDIMGQILGTLPSNTEMQDAILRLSVAYPRDWEAMIDEPAIRQAAEAAFEFHFIRRPRTQVRIRLSAEDPIANLSPQDLLARYWGAVPPADGDPTELNQLAADIFQTVEIGRIPGEGEMHV